MFFLLFFCYFFYLSFRGALATKNLEDINVDVHEILRFALNDNAVWVPLNYYSLLILFTGFSFAIFQVFTTTTPIIISKVTKPVMI